ncbi:VWA domain-containing protein [Candidatus Uhrbacteria bacterium]|nr:VWA domain-containing protein [Candidatus Uhrbacteria bacterium]
MSALEIPADAVLDVRIRLGRDRLTAISPSRVQVLIDTRPQALTRRQTVPVSIRLVVDVSGSMGDPVDHDQESKLEVVKQAILRLLDELTDHDSVLLSVFSTDGRLVVPQIHAHRDSRQRIRNLLKKLKPEQSTNISAGLELALHPVVDGALPRVILFTDGNSSFPNEDHPRLVRLADEARASQIPLSIYGTGSNYNWSLLHQVAIQAGGGSFLKHVMNPSTLEGHMLAELAFLRGTAINDFRIKGSVPDGVKIISVTSMMPLIRKLKHDGHVFRDSTGALDLHRGAQYLVELEVANPQVGLLARVLTMRFRGRLYETGQRFDHTLDAPVTFVENPSEASAPDPEVKKVQLMVMANDKAKEGKFQEASTLYSRAGDRDTSQAMSVLHTASLGADADLEGLTRTGSTLAGGSVTQLFTANPNKS